MLNTNFEKKDYPFLADQAIFKLIKDYDFKTVLDLGCGVGYHTNILKENGKTVTSMDYGRSVGFLLNDNKDEVIITDFLKYDFKNRTFDAVWCSHVLEHQVNPNLFLKKIHSLLKENGIFAISVPPLKHNIVGGHVTLWNAGILLYHLVIAGFDCSEAIVKKYGYNISIIIQKKSIDVSDKIVYGGGDIRTIKPYLPSEIVFSEGNKDLTFDGDIQSINWN